MRRRGGKVIGIDLAGSPRHITGICIYDERIAFRSVHTDEEILSVVMAHDPRVIGIDAPLSFTGAPFRDCDIAVMRICPVLPLTFRGMRQLAMRGMRISSHIKAMKPECEVIEVYPRASERLLKCASNQINAGNRHEYDAFLCALTAKYYIHGKYRELGSDSKIILPSDERRCPCVEDASDTQSCDNASCDEERENDCR